MRQSRFLAVAALAFAACHNTTYTYPEESPVLQPQAKSVSGVEIPNSPPVRDPWTTYFAVKDGSKVVGYVVRYNEPPIGTHNPDRAPTGTLLVEDAAFARIGFVTHEGKGFIFRGRIEEPIGVATIEEQLVTYFGATGLQLEPLVR